MIEEKLKSTGKKMDSPMDSMGQPATLMVKDQISSLSYIPHKLDYS